MDCIYGLYIMSKHKHPTDIPFTSLGRYEFVNEKGTLSNLYPIIVHRSVKCSQNQTIK